MSENNIELKNLLEVFGTPQIYDELIEHGITYDSLKYLSKEDIRDSIKNIGLRATFREKLFTWVKLNHKIDGTTISADSKVAWWLEKEQHQDPFDVIHILQNSIQGQAILKEYKRHSFLTKTNRDELIKIIIEYTFVNHITLKNSDFPKLVEQICNIFASESTAKEYYYIPRQNKKNPGGKLYFKYTNCKSKRFKSHSKSTACDITEEESIEFDYELGTSLKEELRRSIDNWEDVRDKWLKTYHIRKNDVKILSTLSILENWPKYIDARGYELIKLDFAVTYENKDRCLYLNWNKFKTGIIGYYADHIKNTYCKNLFSQLNATNHIDSTDFLSSLLLCSVLEQNVRIKGKRVTIIDAQESFILHLISINDYQRTIIELTNKYFENGNTLQPFLIVEGPKVTEINSFYVFFDKILYKLNSFLEALDVCFKIFQVFDLEYPLTCSHVWTFIQYFFYAIHTSHDIKSSNITAIINFLN